MSKTNKLHIDLINDIWHGCTFMSNSDPAHSDDYPEVLGEIVDSIAENGCMEIEAGTEDFLLAAARLDLVEIEPSLEAPTGYIVTKGILPKRIFKSGIYTFVPDTENIMLYYSNEK